jgi:hypothetical protein
MITDKAQSRKEIIFASGDKLFLKIDKSEDSKMAASGREQKVSLL